MATAVWGRKSQGEVVLCRCDNAAVVAVINSGKSKDALDMHLMRCLFFFQAVFSLSLHAVHLPGKINVAADCLSRDNLPQFFQQVPTAPDSTSRGASQRSDPPSTRLDIQAVEDLVRFYFNKGLALSSQRTYKSAQERYGSFSP